MKTTLEMPDELFRKAKAKAALRGQSLKQLITDALRNELEKKPSASMQSTEQFWRELKTIAKANSKSWKGRKDAVTAVREQRR
ncbi:MAG: hypothetical protein ACREV0_00520 [Burkholderiales bacterium]